MAGFEIISIETQDLPAAFEPGHNYYMAPETVQVVTVQGLDPVQSRYQFPVNATREEIMAELRRTEAYNTAQRLCVPDHRGQSFRFWTRELATDIAGGYPGSEVVDFPDDDGGFAVRLVNSQQWAEALTFAKREAERH